MIDTDTNTPMPYNEKINITKLDSTGRKTLTTMGKYQTISTGNANNDFKF